MRGIWSIGRLVFWIRPVGFEGGWILGIGAAGSWTIGSLIFFRAIYSFGRGG